ncbi:MAG: thiamine pyrophosphate-binding protein [Pseudomonadales bacterium]|nr:thiamine pyrophosphate-binding protein [Pseudomonadales bacterium]
MTTVATHRPDGGELLARTLAEAGVEHVFALHGGHLESFWQGCVRHGLQLTDFRHEASAGHAADAYARTTGRLGVCAITSGPGFTNAITAIANAFLDGIPVLFIVGSPPLRDVETNPLQGGIDQIAMVTPSVKWAHRVTHTERIPELAAQAVRTCLNGRPGPVLLEVPIDVLHIPVDESLVHPPTGLMVRTAPAPAAQDVAAIIAMLRAAERPALFVGNGIRLAAAETELLRLAEATGIPVFCGGHGYGALPYDHPLYGKDLALLSLLGMMGQPGVDALLVVGARFGLFTGGRRGTPVAPGVPVAQIDLHAPELGRLREVRIPVLADAREALRALADAAAGVDWPDRSAWAATATGLKHLAASLYGASDPEATPVHPYHALAAIADAAPPRTIYVVDGGEASAWSHMVLRAGASWQLIGAGYHGCLGVGPGMAIGAAIAHPDKRVLQITGDGAIGFHIQEFETMVRHGLAVVTVILNNRLWGMSAHGQDLVYGRERRVICALPDTPYEAVAAAFGCHAERVERLAELAPALRRALDAGRPACINVLIDPDEMHPSMPAMVGADHPAENEIMIPYYDNIRL